MTTFLTGLAIGALVVGIVGLWALAMAYVADHSDAAAVRQYEELER